MWFAIGPLLLRLYGYFPGARYRVLGDVPPQVMRQWIRWCRNRNYMFAEFPEHRDRYAAVTTNITSIRFTDDDTISPKATAELERWYSSANLTRAAIDPAALGVDHIGHIGVFHRRHRAIWPAVFGHLFND